MSDAFVPVYNESRESWFPCNRAAELVVQLNHIWSDIATVNNVRLKEVSNSVADKLLVKYMVIEFLSLVDVFKELQGIVMRSPRLIRGKPAPMRYITKSEYLETKRLIKDFWRAFQAVEKQLRDIRNEIGAHRSFFSLSLSEGLWARLDINLYLVVINKFIAVFEFVTKLNIYEWSRSFGHEEKSGQIKLSIFGGMIITPWDDAFEDETI